MQVFMTIFYIICCTLTVAQIMPTNTFLLVSILVTLYNKE